MSVQNDSSVLSMRVVDALSYLLVVIVLACECSLFFLAVLPDSFFELCGYHAKYLTSLFTVIGALVALLFSDRMKKLSGYAFGMPILAFVLMCIIMAIVSSFGYGIGLRCVLMVAMPFICVPLLYFALHGMVEDNGLYRFFVNATIFFAFVYAVLCILESFGGGFMNEVYQYTSLRNDRIRIIVSGDFVTFGAVLALGRAFSSRKGRVRNTIAFAVMLFELYWVAQTRYLLVGIAVAAAFGFIFSGKSKVLKIILIIFAALLMASQFSADIIRFFFPSELDVSGVARANAYPYYWGHGFDLGLFGLGYIPSGVAQSSILAMVTTSGFERGDITDIGIVGYLARYGICGAAVLVLSIVYFFRAVKNRDKASFTMSTNIEAWMVLALFVAISPTMAITDAQRIFYLPMVALLVEHALLSPGWRQMPNGARALSVGRPAAATQRA